MNKKVLIVITQLAGGGAERVVSVWANALYSLGCDISLLVFYKLPGEYRINDAIPIYTVSRSKEEYLSLSLLERFRIIRRRIKEIQPLCIVSFFPSVQIWVMLTTIFTNIKRIDTIRVNPWKISEHRWMNRLLWRFSYYTSDAIILQSYDQKPFFTRHDKKKCVVIPNPIADEYVKEYKKSFPEIADSFIAAGRICEQKNYRMMVDGFTKACKYNPCINLKIFGTGERKYVDDLQNYINSQHMDNNIFLMGKSQNMEEEYRKNDFFLLTSNYEGLPNALIEAMASKLVCISTNCKTGPADLINCNDNGYLVEVNDSDNLAEVIISTLQLSRAERIEIGEKARRKVIEYCSVENSSKVLVELITRLML